MCIPQFSFADDSPPVLDIKKFELEGITYVGFLERDAQTLLQYRIDIPKLKLKIEKLEEKVKNNQLQIDTLTSANSTLLTTKDFLTTENVRMQKELDSKESWIRSPYLWFTVGLVVGVAATIAIVYAVN
jgi:hypothetical protein